MRRLAFSSLFQFRRSTSHLMLVSMGSSLSTMWETLRNVFSTITARTCYTKYKTWEKRENVIATAHASCTKMVRESYAYVHPVLNRRHNGHGISTPSGEVLHGQSNHSQRLLPGTDVIGRAGLRIYISCTREAASSPPPSSLPVCPSLPPSLPAVLTS